MIRLLFCAMLLCLLATISAQLGQTPRYFTDLEAGYNIAQKINANDEGGDGLQMGFAFRLYQRLGDKTGLSGGAGAYLHAYEYKDYSSIRFGCDLPVSFGGSGQQTFLTTSQLHAGPSVGLRLHQWVDNQYRWQFQLGGDLLIPVITSTSVDLHECGGSPVDISNEDDNANMSPLLQLTTALTYSIPTPHPKGEAICIGPFFSYTPFPNSNTNSLIQGTRVYTVGLRMSGYRVR